MNANYWLDRATRQIRYAPDRKAVRQELEDHILDRQESYIAQGLGEYEAQQKAVADMGDPNAIAEELGRIHAPWWGYLWKLSRVALVLVVIWFGISAFSHFRQDGLPDYYTPFKPQTGDMFTYASGKTSRVLSTWELEGSVKLGGYRFSVPVAYLEHMEPWTYEDGTNSEGLYILRIYLRSGTWKLWEPSSLAQDMILAHTATDSRGLQYAYGMEEGQDYMCYTYEGSPGVGWYEVKLYLPDGNAPDWVNIPIGCSGDSLRVNLTEGVVTK